MWNLLGCVCCREDLAAWQHPNTQPRLPSSSHGHGIPGWNCLMPSGSMCWYHGRWVIQTTVDGSTQWRKVPPKPDFPVQFSITYGDLGARTPLVNIICWICWGDLGSSSPSSKAQSLHPMKWWLQGAGMCATLCAAVLTPMATRRQGAWGWWHLNCLQEDSPGDDCQHQGRVTVVLLD